MQVIDDAIGFIKTLSYLDIIFFFAVLALMLLVITLVYYIKENNDEDTPNINFTDNNSNKDILELKKITEELENAEPTNVNLNKYEEEQEEKAIISYEELLKHKNDFALNYSEEENIDDELTIKKVDLDNLVNHDIKLTPEFSVTVLSYEKEEAFLKALKALQQKLN